MRDHENTELVGFLGAGHTFGDNAQRVNVKAGVGFIEDGELRLEQFELQHFGTLLLAAGETLVHGTGGELRIHLQALHRLGQFLGPRADGRSLAVDFGFRGAQEVGHRHTWHFNRILHG